MTTHTLVPSDRVEGTPVYGRNSEKLGTIERLMLDKMTGKVAYAVVKHGSMFTASLHHYPLAWDMLKYNSQHRCYDTTLSLNEMRNGPCELDNTFDWGDRSLAETQPHYWGL
jgi:sporulation protein YlmC with PRC-barrel domain